MTTNITYSRRKDYYNFRFEGYDVQGYVRDDTVLFSVNIAPSEEHTEEESLSQVENLLNSLSDEVKYLSAVNRAIKELNDRVPIINIEKNFYWREGDLLIEFSVKESDLSKAHKKGLLSW